MNLEEYCFQPVAGDLDARQRRAAARRTPLSCGNNATLPPGEPRTGARGPGERYTTDSYRRAIERACDAADRLARGLAGPTPCPACGRMFASPAFARRHSRKVHGITLAISDRGAGQRLVPRWTPHRLRHSFATWARREFGVETARTLLGHRHVQVTEIYAEQNRAAAVAVALQYG